MKKKKKLKIKKLCLYLHSKKHSLYMIVVCVVVMFGDNGRMLTEVGVTVKRLRQTF